MRIIVDTNVILDFLLEREPHAASAKGLFEMIYQEKVEAFITGSSVTDIYYVTAKRLGAALARETVKHLITILGIIAVDGNTCAAALDLPIADFEDALIVACASEENIGYIVSNDKEFLQAGTRPVKVVSTQAFLDFSAPI